MKKGLGRGFGSLIPTNLIDETFDPTAQQDVKVSHLRDIAIDQVVQIQISRVAFLMRML